MNNTYVVTVKVSDAGGLSDTHPIQVTVTTINEAPEITTVFRGRTQPSTVNEKHPQPRATIKTYRATGVGEGSVLTWSLEGADRADFTIRRKRPRARRAQVRETRPTTRWRPTQAPTTSYDVRVRVTDSGH